MSVAGLSRQADERLERAGRLHLPVARLLHWVTALLVLVMIVTGVCMKQLGTGPVADVLYLVHKTCGAIVLLLVVARIGFRLGAMAVRRWPRGGASRTIHFVLYAMLLATPFLGWAGVSDFGARQLLFGLELPEVWPYGAGYADTLFLIHAYMAFAMLAVVVVHIGLAMGDYLDRSPRGAEED